MGPWSSLLSQGRGKLRYPSISPIRRKNRNKVQGVTLITIAGCNLPSQLQSKEKSRCALWPSLPNSQLAVIMCGFHCISDWVSGDAFRKKDRCSQTWMRSGFWQTWGKKQLSLLFAVPYLHLCYLWHCDTHPLPLQRCLHFPHSHVAHSCSSFKQSSHLGQGEGFMVCH